MRLLSRRPIAAEEDERDAVQTSRVTIHPDLAHRHLVHPVASQLSMKGMGHHGPGRTGPGVQAKLKQAREAGVQAGRATITGAHHQLARRVKQLNI